MSVADRRNRVAEELKTWRCIGLNQQKAGQIPGRCSVGGVVRQAGIDAEERRREAAVAAVAAVIGVGAHEAQLQAGRAAAGVVALSLGAVREAEQHRRLGMAQSPDVAIDGGPGRGAVILDERQRHQGIGWCGIHLRREGREGLRQLLARITGQLAGPVPERPLQSGAGQRHRFGWSGL
jgi:hypothetical protein